MKWFVIVIIRLYQILISPRKGFSCAHRILHGGASCSEVVKNIVMDKGLISGYREIRSQFSSCSTAARRFREMPVQDKHKVFECGGSDSCADPLSGCGDLFGGGSTPVDCGVEGGTGTKTGASSTNTVLFVPMGLLFALLFLSFMGWSYGQKVSTIQVRLLENVIESRDKYIGKLIGSELPDYQILLATSKREIKTNTLRDVSAVDWLFFHPNESLKISNIETISIIEKDVFGDKVLDVIPVTKKSGRGEHFEFIIEKNFNLF